MTVPVFPFAGLLTAHTASASDGEALARLARTVADTGASPVIVALAPGIEAPAGARTVRTRAQGSAIAAIRLGMAQLTNSVARAVLLVPLGAERWSLVELLALVDASKRDEQAIVALSDARLDESAVLIPRDAWLELMTVGQSGMDAVAARRRVVRVSPERG
jgi:hypothetical protein